MRGAGATIGFATLLLGYSVLYYGITQVQGGNWGYFDLLLPSRWPGKAQVPRDAPSSASSSPTNSVITVIKDGIRVIVPIPGL